MQAAEVEAGPTAEQIAAPEAKALTKEELGARVTEAINQLITLDRAETKSLRDYVNLKSDDYRPKESERERRKIVDLLLGMIPTTELDPNSDAAKEIMEIATLDSESRHILLKNMERRVPSFIGRLKKDGLTPEKKQEILAEMSALKGELKFFSEQTGEDTAKETAESDAFVAANIDTLKPGTTLRPEPLGEPLISDIVEDRIANEKRKDLVRVDGKTFDDIGAYVESSTRADEPAELTPGAKIDLRRTIAEGPKAVARIRKEIQRELTDRVISLSAAERDNLPPEDVTRIHQEVSVLKGELKFLKDTIAAEKPVIRERKKTAATKTASEAAA